MKPLLLALSAACLALAVAACSGGGAESAGPVPSVPLEAEPSATSPADTAEGAAGTEPTKEEYIAQAEAICQRATDRIEAALGVLDETGFEFGELVYRISAQTLDELRELPWPKVVSGDTYTRSVIQSPPGLVNPFTRCSGASWTRENANPLMTGEYIDLAADICNAATQRFRAVEELQPIGRGWELEDQAAWYETAVRFSEEVLAELRALTPPPADRAMFYLFYSLLEQQTDALRQAAAAASAGDTARAALLGAERTHLTHQKDEFADYWGGPRLQSCPVGLPA
jgi:hypothetical protein